jgi:hypothetical protein
MKATGRAPRCPYGNLRARTRSGASLETEFANKRRVLIEVAVPNPRRLYDEVNDAWPTHSRRAVRPHLEIDCPIPFQLRRLEFLGLAFVLDRLLTRPTDHKRTVWPGDEVWIFARTLHGVENDLQVRRDRKPDQGRLRRVGTGHRAKNAQPVSPDKSVQVRFAEHREVPQLYDEAAVNATSILGQQAAATYPCLPATLCLCASPARSQRLHKSLPEGRDAG